MPRGGRGKESPRTKPCGRGDELTDGAYRSLDALVDRPRPAFLQTVQRLRLRVTLWDSARLNSPVIWCFVWTPLHAILPILFYSNVARSAVTPALCGRPVIFAKFALLCSASLRDPLNHLTTQDDKKLFRYCCRPAAVH